MRRAKKVLLALMAGGCLLESGCDLAEQILETIRLAFGIADIWA
jgi:hypothetical protein